jgi:hypothetical protein
LPKQDACHRRKPKTKAKAKAKAKANACPSAS